MVHLQFNVIFTVIFVTSRTSECARPKPAPLGVVIPSLQGWGWSTSTPPPETTTGWPAEETTTEGWTDTTTTAPPETTTTAAPGWPAQGWPAPGGWNSPPGWAAQPAGLPIEIEMVGESAVLGDGEAGATHGSQTIVSGDASNPAFVQISAGSYSSLGQGSGILQTSTTNAAGDSAAFQGVDGYNFGDSGEYFGGTLSGNEVNTLTGGGSFVLGEGAVVQGGYTENTAGVKKNK